MTHIDWDDLRVFLAAARAGQFLGAARSLALNHATVARRIGTLERDLGLRLFVRTTTGSRLSPDGERLLAHAERVESEILAASGAARRDLEVTGSVRIGAPDGFGVAFLIPRIGELAERHPGLQIELVPVPRTFSLSKREADIAVTMERPREGRLVARKLTDYVLGLYASKDYLARHGTPAEASDLGAHRLVGYVDDLIYSPALDYAAEVFPRWRTSVAVSSAIGQLAAVRSGCGIGVLHTFMADGEPDLVRLLPETALWRTYWTVVHEDLRELERIALVSGFLAEIVARDRHRFVA